MTMRKRPVKDKIMILNRLVRGGVIETISLKSLMVANLSHVSNIMDMGHIRPLLVVTCT